VKALSYRLSKIATTYREQQRLIEIGRKEEFEMMIPNEIVFASIIANSVQDTLVFKID